MKKLLFVLLVLLGKMSFSQLLVRNLQGELLFSPNPGENTKNTLININTGAQSVGADYIFTTKAANPSDYRIYRLGLSAKATEGVGPLLTNGQFSPGAKFTASRTKIKLFANNNIIDDNGLKRKFDDWLTLSFSYAYEKNKLFRKDTLFAKQIMDTTFSGYSLGFDYNMVFGREEQDYINLQLTYQRKNNYSDLNSVDVIDKRIIFDSASATQRSVEKKVVAKEGVYKEMDAAFMQITYTHLPKYQFKNLKGPDGADLTIAKTEVTKEVVTHVFVIDSIVGTDTFKVSRAQTEMITRTTSKLEPIPNPNFKSLKFGYSLFYNVLSTPREKPDTKLGASFFLISPDKDGNLIPRLALNLQIIDLFDMKGLNNGIKKRLQAGLTATFSL